jgi:hypothetical protein
MRNGVGGRRGGALLLALLVAGCANDDGPPGGDPGARPLPPGYTCQSVRAELDKLDRSGAQAKVEAASRGGRVSPETKATADRYNLLLNYYLGARCHV